MTLNCIKHYLFNKIEYNRIGYSLPCAPLSWDIGISPLHLPLGLSFFDTWAPTANCL